MPRVPRNYLKTTFFHIITQGINKSFIFEYPEDIKYYISIMYKIKEEHGVKLIAYCIMNNHAHMLIETENLKELSKYMQRLNTKYGIYYNKKYNRAGYVFRDRYKSEGIYGKQHLYSCIKYIYNNPVKAGMCDKAEDYPYSNYKKIANKAKEDYLFIDVNEEKEEICKTVINNFLDENNIDLIKLKEDKIKLRYLIITLKNDYNISLRKIGECLDICRETIRNIYRY